MKKRKTYEISVINKTYSKSYSDQTKFYTSDTSLELNFQLKEVEYYFDSAEIILLNVDDRSLVTRPVSKSAEGFTYELEDDIVVRYGEWKGQLKFKEGDEIYVSSPVSFKIENDLNNDRPPQLTEVNTWKNLRAIADELIGDLRIELESVTTQVSEIEGAESERQNAELARVENEKQRNLTSINEFIKLQNAVGGRNIIFNSDKVVSNSNYALTVYSLNINEVKANDEYSIMVVGELSDGQSGWYLNLRQIINGVEQSPSMVSITASDRLNQNTWVKTFKISVDTDLSGSTTIYSLPIGNLKPSKIEKIKLTKGKYAIPYTKAPEDYTVVSKDDYYNHIELINNEKNNQFNQLKQAVIALGGTI